MNSDNIIAQNRKARFEYIIEQEFEAGIILLGSEVKSIRQGKANINDAHASEMDGSIYLFNAYIAPFEQANQFNHEPRRPRKLLLHQREISKLIGKVKVKGYTLIALSMYFNKRNKVKILIGLGKGKKLHDKRASIKEREWKRTQERMEKGGE